MKPEKLKEGMLWLRQAEQDMDDAMLLAEHKRHNSACFLAQQAAEKALKAFLYAQGAEDVWGHSIAELAYDAEKLDRDFADLRPKVSPLDKYYIPTRYPGSLPGGSIPSETFDSDDAEKAMRLAKQTINFVKRKLGGQQPQK
jgi:HEPN domain-containing protein